MTELPQTEYWTAYQAKSYGVLRWAQMDALWAVLLRSTKHWYIHDFDQSPPDSPASTADLATFLQQASEFIKQRQQGEYCGCIYVDDFESPQFIRLFDPKNMGTLCTHDGPRVFPKWSLSLIKPEERPVADLQKPKKGWLKRRFSPAA